MGFIHDISGRLQLVNLLLPLLVLPRNRPLLQYTWNKGGGGVGEGDHSLLLTVPTP